MQVLMIEDNENDFLHFRRLISKINNVKIEWCNTVAMGLAYIESHPIDVLVLDMALPDGHGLAILDNVQIQFPQLPIIILSGDDTDELALEAVRHGAQDYLVKGRVDGQTLSRSLSYAVERKRLEERLQRSEELYRTFARNFPNGALILYDHDLRYTLVDGLGMGELGLSKEEMEGKTIWDFFPAEVAAAGEPRLRSVLAGQTISQEVVYAGQTLLVNYVPIRDSSGTIIGGMIMSQNITKGKRAEARFRSLLESAPDAMVIVNHEGNIVLVNSQTERVFGYSRDELIDQPIEMLIPAAFRTLHPDHRTQYTKAPRARMMGTGLELYALHKDGSQFPVEISLSPIETDEGVLIASTIRDISERRRDEDALRAKAKQELEFQNYLKALQEITIELTNVSDLDEFYKLSVQYGLERLGFDRLGLLLYDPEDAVAIGTYGTDAQGKLVAEHHLRLDPSQLTGILTRAMQKEERFAVDEEAQLFSNLESIGTGWNAAAVLWNGTEKLGWLATDNAVQHQPMTQTQLNVLALYALTLGTLLGQKRAQIAVQESERRLRLVAQNSPDVIYIMSLTEQRATYLNRHEFLGYSQSEVEEAGLLLNALHPNDKERVLAHWRKLMANCEPNLVTMIEYRLQDKSGQWRWIQSRETIFASTSDGKPAQVLVTLTDITERKQAEESLTQERDLLRTLIDNLPDIIFIKDCEGRFILSNIAHAQAVSLKADEIVGKTTFEVFPPDIAVQSQAEEEQIIQSGQPLINSEFVRVGKNGEAQTLLTSKIPLRDKNGQITSLIGILRDITELKQLESQTVELASERGRIKVMRRFIHDMSHDFRTPLAVINSNLYLLQKHTDPQKQQVYAKRAEKQILRMDNLLEELLQMEHLDQDETAFQFSLTEINAFLAPLIQEYEPLVVSKQLTLQFVSDVDACFARIDTVEFARAMTKLMDNAIAYTAKGGSIIVRTNTESNWTVISVQDTGIGIAASDLPHIFEHFYRADQARSTETGGSGLGLSIVRKIIEAHNGSIEVESTVGQGSKLTIKLPSHHTKLM